MDRLRRMAVFASVVERRSMRGAAAELGLTPSAVSQHLRRLERELGVALLHRTTRKLSPTVAGERYYEGCAEMVRAARRIAEEVQAGTLRPEQVDEAVFAERLYTADCPDPDLLIRTSGEQRVSNFLLWQLAYTEIFISPLLWPDFGRAHLFEAILDFQNRDRRFGRVPA